MNIALQSWRSREEMGEMGELNAALRLVGHRVIKKASIGRFSLVTSLLAGAPQQTEEVTVHQSDTQVCSHFFVWQVSCHCNSD